MTYEDVRAAVGDVPYTSPAGGRLLYDQVLRSGAKTCLELGFAHGVASAYIGAALDERGEGEIHAVDLVSEAERRKPSIEELFAHAGLTRYLRVFREATSYTWFLKKQIEARTHDHRCHPLYDLCFVDGGKNWTIDGMAFFCVDKLLNEGGWIIFDDLDWHYSAKSGSVVDGITIRDLGEDERATPHIRAVFELLVMQHERYGEFRETDNGWGWARKVRRETKTIAFESHASLAYSARRRLKLLLDR